MIKVTRPPAAVKAGPERSTVRWVPVTDTAPAVRRSRLLITCAVAASQPVLACTLGAMERYAARVNADLVVLADATQEWPMLEKFRVAQFAAAYDRTLFLDADVFVRSSAPDIFEEVPAGRIGIHNDLPCLLKQKAGTGWMHGECAAIAKSQGWPVQSHSVCLNSGVVLTDKKDADVWSPPAQSFPVYHCAEQHIVQQRITGTGRTHYLPEAWNYQWWANRDFSGVDQAHFIHLAGMSKEYPEMLIPTLRALSLQP